MSQTKAIVNKLLTNVSNGIFPVGYIADKVFPQIVVKQKTGLIGSYGMDHLRLSDDLMGGRAEARRVDPITRSNATYNIQSHGLEGVCTQDDYDNVEDPFQCEADETAGVTHLLLTNKERALAADLFSTSVITSYTTPGTKYGSSSSDPLADFKTAKNTVLGASGAMPNAAVMSRKVANTLMYNAQIKDIVGFKYNAIGNLSDEQLKVVLGVDELIIADAPYNSAKEGQSASLAQIWGDSILFYVKPKSAAKYQVSLGYQMKLASQLNRSVYKYPLDNPPGANGIIVQDAYQFKLINVGAAHLLDSVL